MKIQNLYMALCEILMSTHIAIAQQNMAVLGNDGCVNVVSVSSVHYATFNADDKWFAITIDENKLTTEKTISTSCSVVLAADSGIKDLSVAPQVGVCYSQDNAIPTITDECLKLGTELDSYTFTLSSLIPGTTYYFRAYIKIANGIFYGEVAQATTLGSKPIDNSKVINGHRFVDLGLPSGLLWAKTNIGASVAADDGKYYAWGEIEDKSNYSWSTYKYGASSTELIKYNSTDGKAILDKEDDAAYVNWGTYCRMPTQKEFEELLDPDNCTWSSSTMTTSSGSSISGYKVTSISNGNSIFIPASGYCDYSFHTNHGLHCYLWSSTLYSYNTNDAYSLYFYGSQRYLSVYDRYIGHPVRPVVAP